MGRAGGKVSLRGKDKFYEVHASSLFYFAEEETESHNGDYLRNLPSEWQVNLIRTF